MILQRVTSSAKVMIHQFLVKRSKYFIYLKLYVELTFVKIESVIYGVGTDLDNLQELLHLTVSNI